MKQTTRDEININLDGSIDSAIKELNRLKKLYPKGEISLENEYEYGVSYARLKLNFTRPLEPIEIELGRWHAKREKFDAMRKAAKAYKSEGDRYPRADEMAALEEELGGLAEPSSSLIIHGGEIVAWGFEGIKSKDGRWIMRNFAFPEEKVSS